VKSGSEYYQGHELVVESMKGRNKVGGTTTMEAAKETTRKGGVNRVREFEGRQEARTKERREPGGDRGWTNETDTLTQRGEVEKEDNGAIG